MARLSGIVQADPVSYTATLGSESVTITFDSSRMTGRWERDIRRAMADEDVDTVADRLFGVFIAWDVVDDDGRPVPMSPDVLMDLPSKALQALFVGMQEATVPSSEEGNASSGISSTASMASTPQPVSPPNGLTTSPSPTPSTSPSPT